jgi:hypothetical protein
MTKPGSLARIVTARCCCALLALLTAGAVLALDQKLSAKNLAGAYLGLEVLFSLIGILANLRLGFQFLARYILLTALWLGLVVIAMFKLG